VRVARISMVALTSAAVAAGAAVLLPETQSPMRIVAVLRSSLDEAPAKTVSAAPPPVVVVAAPGRVEPTTMPLELALSTIGQLKAVYVAAGDEIRRSELLAELDNADQHARVEETEATVALRQAQLEKLMNGARPEERREAAAQLAEAQAGLAYAKSEFNRQMPLAQAGASSRQSLDQTESSLQTAEAKEEEAAAALALLNAPPRVEDVAIAKANLAMARARLAEQQAMLDKTQLRSPIDGIVLRRYLRGGEAVGVTPPTPILEVGDTSRLRVRAEIDQTDIGRVAVGDRAWVTADAYPGRRFGGVVTWLAARVGRKTVHTDDPTDRSDTQVIDALIDLDHGIRLPVGLRVDVAIDTSQAAKN
jgi:HlyD family secretion protein